MHATEDKENFVLELSSLHKKIISRIETLSEMLSFHNGSAPNNKVSEINELKLQKYKIENTITKTKQMNQMFWDKQKEELINQFEEAKKILV